MTTHTETKSKTEHSPLPWCVGLNLTDRVYFNEQRDGIHCVAQCLVCDWDASNPSISRQQSGENAEYIVRACNSFPALLAALEQLVNSVEVNEPTPIYDPVISAARAAIAAAKAP